MAYTKPAVDVRVFKNNKKAEGSKQPDYTGIIEFSESFTFNPGDTLDVSLWLRTAKSGNKFMAGEAKKPYNRQNPQGSAPVARQYQDEKPAADNPVIDF